MFGGEIILVEVSEQAIINASANDVWKTIRTFDGVEKYLPMISHSEVDGKGVGSTRTCTISGIEGQGDSKAVEKLDYLNDDERTISYSILEIPMPVKDMVNTVQIKDLGNSKSEIIWKSRFEPNGIPEDQANKMIQDILLMAISGLKTLHESPNSGDMA